MADDNILRIGAEFDVAPIIAGANTAGNAIEGLGAKISTMSAEDSAALDGVSAAVQSLTVQSLNASAATTSEADALDGVARAAAAAAPAIERKAAASLAAASAAHSHAEANIEARLTTDALTGNISRAENALIRFAAHSELIGPLMEVAFAPIAIGVFIDFLVHASEAIKKLTDDAMGYTKAVQEQEKENIKWSQSTEASALTVVDSQKQISSIAKEMGSLAEQTFGDKWVKANREAIESSHGLTAAIFDQIEPLLTLFTAQDKAADRAKLLGKEFAEAAKQALTLRENAEHTALALSATAEAADKSARPGDRVAQLQIELQYLKEKEEREKRIAADKVGIEAVEKGGGPGGALAAAQAAQAEVAARFANERKELTSKLSIEESKQQLDLAQSTAEKLKTLAEAEVSFEESKTREAFEAHRIAVEEETTQLVNEENRRIEAVRKFYDEEIRLTKARGAATGEDVAPKVNTLTGDRDAAEIKSQEKITDIRAKGTQEALKLDQERALRAIQINEQVIESDDKLAQHRADVALRKADTPEEIGTAEAASIAASTKAINDQVAAIEKENVVLAKDPSESSQAKIAENIAKIQELRNTETRDEEDSAREKTDRIEEYYRQELSTAKQVAEESLRVTEDGYKNQMEAARTLFEERAIGGKQYIDDVKAIASEELAAELNTYAQELQQVQNLYNAELISYKEYASQKAAIDKQISEAERRAMEETAQASQQVTKRQEQDIKQLADAWGNDWVRMANEVIQHRETISVAVRNMMGEIELQMIDNGIKKIVTNYAQDLLQLLAAHTQFISQYLSAHGQFLLVLLGLETANQAKNKAVLTAADAAKLAEQTLLQAKETALITASQTEQTTAVTVAQTAQTAAVTTAQATQTTALATSKAAQVAANAVGSAAEISQEAGVSGAAGFASAMVALPFPVNVAVAPGIGAAAAAATLGFLGFVVAGAEKGAIVPADMPINMHKDEMVLPAPISKGLQGAIPAISNFNSAIEKSGGDSIQSLVNNNSSSQTTNQGPRYIRPTINFNGGSASGMKHEDIVKSVRQAMRNGELRL